MALKDIKNKIKSVDRTRKVTKAMEAVSAVKMRKSQVRAITARPYANSALSILERMSVSLSTVRHPLTESREVKKAAFVVVTSDKGLCGILNAAVIREAYLRVQASGLPTEMISIYAFGRKGAEFFERRGYTIVERFENVSDDIVVGDLSKVSNDIARAFAEKDYDRVDIIYTNFRSTFEQSAIAHTVLPLSLETLSAVVKGITPEKGKVPAPATTRPAPVFYTVEPSPEAVVNDLISSLVGVLFYHSLLESKASEHSARMIAMKNASDKSRDLSKALTRTFNKARQAMITREVSEIVGGIEAMAAK
ncbi:ATP synthase F1 subunit gamma [Patescibacteria group bacterium]|nr:ATP synthase F1 subunit gamma [Patescibacteria group bacterium]